LRLHPRLPTFRSSVLPIFLCPHFSFFHLASIFSDNRVSCLLIQSHAFLLAGIASNTAQLPERPSRVLGLNVSNPSMDNIADLKPRQDTTAFISTCGYVDGDPNQPRTANPGFDCRSDTLNGLWGFCPTTVIAATDCGLAGNCVDLHGCTSGCGIFGNPSITTFTWCVTLAITLLCRYIPRALSGCRQYTFSMTHAADASFTARNLVTITARALF